MKIIVEATNPAEFQRVLSIFVPKKASPVKVRPVHRARRVKVVHVIGKKHRLKCQLCGRGFLSKRSHTKYCGKPCQTHHIGTPMGRRLAGEVIPAKRKFTRAQLDAVKKNLAKARKARWEKSREKKAPGLVPPTREHRGTTLVAGDPLRAAQAVQ